MTKLTMDAGKLGRALNILSVRRCKARALMECIRLDPGGITAGLASLPGELKADIHVRIPMQVEGDGVLVVNALALKKAIAKRAGPVTIEAKTSLDASAEVDGVTTTIPTLDPEDWWGQEVLAIGPDLAAITMTWPEWERLSAVRYAAHREKTRYAMNGLSVSVQDGMVVQVAATDGKRLHVRRKAIDNLPAGWPSPSVVIPTRAVEVANALASWQVKLAHVPATGLDPGQVLIQAGHGNVMVEPVAGHFPPYRDVIPKNSEVLAEVDTRSLLLTLRGVKRDQDQDPMAGLLPRAGDLAIKVWRHDVSAFSVLRATTSTRGTVPVQAVNARYLAEMVGASVTRSVKLAWEVNGSPHATGPITINEPDGVALLMPIDVGVRGSLPRELSGLDLVPTGDDPARGQPDASKLADLVAQVKAIAPELAPGNLSKAGTVRVNLAALVALLERAG